MKFLAIGQSLTISGRLQDQSTREQLVYASVGVKGKALSTVTNLNGEFDFHIPNEYRNEILIISMLGYANYEAPVWSVLQEAQVILLEKSPTILDEIQISDSLTGGEILRIAFSRIESNFADAPFILDGFYRDIKKVGGTYISLLEAAVQIYDETYKEPRNKLKLRENVRLIEVRRSLGYENKFTSFFDQHNLLEDLLLHNDIRYRNLKTTDQFMNACKRERDSHYNGQDIFVISFDGKYHLKIFIAKEDFSCIHIDYESPPTDVLLEKRQGMVSRFAGLKKSIDFKKFNNKMYLNFMIMTSNVNWYHKKTGKLLFETELYQQLLINEVHDRTHERITSTEKMRNYGLQYHDVSYNKKFWDSYNVIKETPVDKKILSDLEKNIPLEKQFQSY